MQLVGSLSKWYLAKLKASPVITNLSSAFLLMTTGDVMAQELEGCDLAVWSEEVTQRLHVSFFRAGSEGSMIAMTGLRSEETSAWDEIRARLSSKDPVRTATMAGWSVCFHTPFYLGIFKLYNRYLPHQTPASIVTRVCLSFLASVPINAAFYTYGTMTHHGIDWVRKQQSLLQQNEWNLQNLSKNATPFSLDVALDKTFKKLEAELPRTTANSASCWIPVNFLTFSVVPRHLQPITLMSFSVFWNCYLSMSQHREVED